MSAPKYLTHSLYSKYVNVSVLAITNANRRGKAEEVGHAPNCIMVEAINQ